MKSANQIDRVSRRPSHDTGKLAQRDKLASSVLWVLSRWQWRWPSSWFLRAGGQQYWRWGSIQTGERHGHVTIEQCGELEKCVWPLQPSGTQRGDRTKAAPEMYAGEQRTWGQKQSTWRLCTEESWSEGSWGEGWAVEGDGADVGAGEQQLGRGDFQAFGFFAFWGKRWRLGFGARWQI